MFLGKWRLSDKLMGQLEASRSEKIVLTTILMDGYSLSCIKTIMASMPSWNLGPALKMTLLLSGNSKSLELKSLRKVKTTGMILSSLGKLISTNQARVLKIMDTLLLLTKSSQELNTMMLLEPFALRLMTTALATLLSILEILITLAHTLEMDGLKR